VQEVANWSFIKPSYLAKEFPHKTSCSFIATPADMIHGIAQRAWALGLAGAIFGLAVIAVAVGAAAGIRTVALVDAAGERSLPYRREHPDRTEFAVHGSDQLGDVARVVTLRCVNHDRGAGLGVGERVVVLEVFEPGRHRRTLPCTRPK